MTIVGVVGGTRLFLLPPTDPYHPEMYRPLAQAPARGLLFVVHTDGPDGPLVPLVRRAVREVAPGASVGTLTTIEDILNSRWLAPVRMNAVVLGALAVLALIIASLGLYGVVACLVGDRVQEIAVRMALGAPRSIIVSLILRSAIAMVLWGVAAGLVGSLALARRLRAFLHGASPTDPRVFAAAAVVLLAVAVLAAFIPARRATRVDPMLALRSL